MLTEIGDKMIEHNFKEATANRMDQFAWWLHTMPFSEKKEMLMLLCDEFEREIKYIGN